MCLQNRQRQKPHTKSTISSSFPILITLQFTNKAKNKILILIFKKLPNVNCKSPTQVQLRIIITAHLPLAFPSHLTYGSQSRGRWSLFPNTPLLSLFATPPHTRYKIMLLVIITSKHSKAGQREGSFCFYFIVL